jgi:hypothetical protein
MVYHSFPSIDGGGVVVGVTLLGDRRELSAVLGLLRELQVLPEEGYVLIEKLQRFHLA